MEKIKKVTKNEKLESITFKHLNFYQLKGTKSKISCHGLPKSKEIKHFKLTYGVNTILTLLGKKEKPEKIKEICELNGINWKFIEISGANMSCLSHKKTMQIIIENLLELIVFLIFKETVLFVHCAAGLHRTGTIIYSILRCMNEDKESAMLAIKQIRAETFDKVGSERIKFAEEGIVPILQEKLNERLNLIFKEVNKSDEHNDGNKNSESNI